MAQNQNQNQSINRYENAALNEKSLKILEQAQAELAPRSRNSNPEILRIGDGQSYRLRFIIFDKDGNRHPEFNKEVEVPYPDPPIEGVETTYSRKRHFRVINLDNGGKSQLWEVAKSHATPVLAMMKEMMTSEVRVKRIGKGKDDTNYIALPLGPETVM